MEKQNDILGTEFGKNLAEILKDFTEDYEYFARAHGRYLLFLARKQFEAEAPWWYKLFRWIGKGLKAVGRWIYDEWPGLVISTLFWLAVIYVI